MTDVLPYDSDYYTPYESFDDIYGSDEYGDDYWNYNYPDYPTIQENLKKRDI